MSATPSFPQPPQALPASHPLAGYGWPAEGAAGTRQAFQPVVTGAYAPAMHQAAGSFAPTLDHFTPAASPPAIVPVMPQPVGIRPQPAATIGEKPAEDTGLARLVQILRFSPVRLVGFTNEVGQAMSEYFPKFVGPSWAINLIYTVLTSIVRGAHTYETKRNQGESRPEAARHGAKETTQEFTFQVIAGDVVPPLTVVTGKQIGRVLLQGGSLWPTYIMRNALSEIPLVGRVIHHQTIPPRRLYLERGLLTIFPTLEQGSEKLMGQLRRRLPVLYQHMVRVRNLNRNKHIPFYNRVEMPLVLGSFVLMALMPKTVDPFLDRMLEKYVEPVLARIFGTRKKNADTPQQAEPLPAHQQLAANQPLATPATVAQTRLSGVAPAPVVRHQA